MFRHFLYLTLMGQFNGDRSPSAVFHLLKGKRTSQTIQDGFTYGVHPFFKSFPYVSRDNFDKDLKVFQVQGWVEESGVNQCELTRRGKEALEQFRETYDVPQGLNGWQVEGQIDLFWPRLTLMVQTLSHLLVDKKNFLTLTSDPVVLQWGKQFFLSSPYSRKDLANRLYEDLHRFLETRPEQQQTLFVHRLSGYQKEGVTFDQLSFYFNKEKEELLVTFKAALDACVTQVMQAPEDFSILSKLINSVTKTTMTHSAQETYEWFKRGLSLDAIATKRGLKLSTIHDHIVEIARLNPSRIPEELLPEEIRLAILAVLQTNPSRRLSELKKQLPDSCTYFHIRLALVSEEVIQGASHTTKRKTRLQPISTGTKRSH